ncbi:hypothetical protein MES4922_190006 [Mesorhizobium ventifaucium]|uniref:Uncharacterized protein n=1 Tax=Mesorhizobium ventifaucium TaxID=666020 RepID=A0ABN8JIH1_9HYPH|nr:hypothetical protein MES4922_190006 [Mesorhizobium ventifaucium]
MYARGAPFLVTENFLRIHPSSNSTYFVDLNVPSFCAFGENPMVLTVRFASFGAAVRIGIPILSDRTPSLAAQVGRLVFRRLRAKRCRCSSRYRSGRTSK